MSYRAAVPSFTLPLQTLPPPDGAGGGSVQFTAVKFFFRTFFWIYCYYQVYLLVKHFGHLLGTAQRPPTRQSTLKLSISLSSSKYIPCDAQVYVALPPNSYGVAASKSAFRFMPSGNGGSIHWIHSQSSICKRYFPWQWHLLKNLPLFTYRSSRCPCSIPFTMKINTVID